jgi:hypothetical protein
MHAISFIIILDREFGNKLAVVAACFYPVHFEQPKQRRFQNAPQANVKGSRDRHSLLHNTIMY